MKVETKNCNLNRIFRSTAKRWGVKEEGGCQELMFALPEKHGAGNMRTFDFEDGLQVFLFDGKLKEPLEWKLKLERASPFMMFFLVRGEALLKLKDSDKDLPLTPLQTVFVAHPPGKNQVIEIAAEKNTLLLLLKIEREIYIDHVDCFSEPVSKELASIFSGETAIKTFKNHTDYGLQGAGLIQEILADEQGGLARATFVKGRVLDLFSLQLKRWEEEVNSPQEKMGFRPEDIEKLNEARALLIKDLQNAPTIEELAKLAGLNRQKLKQGFRRMFGKTINEFLRHERLRIGRQMLSNSNPIIKEVAAKVGYENASYFARRFKEKYGIYPSEYMKLLYERTEEEE